MNLRFLTAGESHGPALVAILDGMPAGLQLDMPAINHELMRRQKGFGSGKRMEIEKDRVQILSGVMDGKTTGAPIAVLLENKDHKNWKGKPIEQFTAPRPGHADLTGVIKYGYRDIRPALERASARETAMRVAIGAICKQFLKQFGIIVGGYVRAIGGVQADIDNIDLMNRFEQAEKNDVRCPDQAAVEKIRARIQEVIESGDTLGGIIEVFAAKMPVGLGSYVQADRRLDACLAKAIMSVQAVKGVEIGDAFNNTDLNGSKVHDEIRLENAVLSRSSNRAGGIEGGISNGSPIIIRAAMKPIATTITPLKTVDLASGKESKTKYERSDYCPVPRAVPVLEAVTAVVLSEMLIQKLGGDSMSEMLMRYKALPTARLNDVPVDDQPTVWWE